MYRSDSGVSLADRVRAVIADGIPEERALARLRCECRLARVMSRVRLRDLYVSLLPNAALTGGGNAVP
jgi:hypothetical protein